LPDQSGSLIPRAVPCRGRSSASSEPGSPSNLPLTGNLARRHARRAFLEVDLRRTALNG
jgi:hypothetical protein